jgi:hypothetical protein
MKIKTKQVAMTASYYFMLVAIPACLLAYVSWQTAQFVVNPVPMGETMEISVPHQPNLKIYTPTEAKAKVISIAEARKFAKIDTLLAIIECESHFNQFALHNNKDGTIDRGIMQWNSYFHSKMTNEQAFNVEYSVNKAIDYLIDGKNVWVCSLK